MEDIHEILENSHEYKDGLESQTIEFVELTLEFIQMEIDEMIMTRFPKVELSSSYKVSKWLSPTTALISMNKLYD